MQKVYFKNISKIIKNLLEDSEYEIKIAVAWFSDKVLIKELEKCLNRGVKVSIIIYDKSNDKNLYKNLYQKNAKIATTKKLMHNKFCVIDNRIVINGSYNWTYSARTNHENIQVTVSRETAQEFTNEFENILNSFTTSYNRIETHFGDKQKAFEEYFEKQIKPTSFPIFYKIDLTKKLKNFIERRNLFKYNIPFKHLYKFILNYEDYLIFHQNLFEISGKSYLNFPEDYSKVSSLYTSYIKIENSKPPKDITSFIFLDFVTNDILLKEITLKDYDNEFHFCKDRILYFANYKKNNFISICVKNFNSQYKNAGYDLNINLLNNPKLTLVEDLGNLEWNKVIINKEEILFRRYSYYEVISKSDFQIDNEKTTQNKLNAIKEAKEKEAIDLKKRNEERERIRKSNDCYIATMVYNNPNHPNIIKLREFRNSVLLTRSTGIFFVKLYYRFSPFFVNIFKNNKAYKQSFKTGNREINFTFYSYLNSKIF